ncbi:class I SAM-dependent methyltransferase [Streptomyces sp. NPDC004788]
MTPTLVPHHPARDWAEIQERMLVPLYEAVYDRLGVGAGSRVLGLGCGSGLALLMAAARGARVAGVDRDRARLALAAERLPGTPLGTDPADTAGVREAGPYDVITAFHGAAGLAEVTRLAEPGAAVVVAGWGPPERCATASVRRVAARLAGWHAAERDGLRDHLAEAVGGAGLRLSGSGRVACPFGYADRDSAVRGLLSTGEFDAAVRVTDPDQVEKELLEALEPYARRDGTVWMPNVFRYVVARVP